MKKYFTALFSLLFMSILVGGQSEAMGQVPTVQLLDMDCGIMDYTSSDIIKSSQPQNTDNVIYYEWRFEELEAPFDVFEYAGINGSNPNFRLKWFDGIEYGRAYNVSVRIAINPGTMVGDYGPQCVIGIQENVLTTELEPEYEFGFYGYCDVLGAEPVGAADRYRWTFNNFDDPEFSVYGDGESRLLRISKAGLPLGETFIVRVFAEVNGQESLVGGTSFINTVNFVANTGLNEVLFPCGSNLPINTAVQANEVCRAESYTWRFQNTSQMQEDLFYTRTDGSRFISLEWVSGLNVGDSYDVSVKAAQGGLDGDYSSICNITIGESDAPMLVSAELDPVLLVASTGNRLAQFAFRTELRDESGSVQGQAKEKEFESTAQSLAVNVLNNGKRISDGSVVISASTTELQSNVRFELYDLNGRLMADQRNIVVKSGSMINLQVPGLTPGVYILRAINGSEITSEKVAVF